MSGRVFWTIVEKYTEDINDLSLVWRIQGARLLADKLSQQRARQRGKEDASLAEISGAFSSILPEAHSKASDLMAFELEEEQRELVYPTGALTGIEIFRPCENAAAENPTVGDFLRRISTQDADFTLLARFLAPGE